MPFSAKFFIDNRKESYTVLNFSWYLRQRTDQVRRPDALVQGGKMRLVLNSLPDEFLENWARHDTKKINCNIVVYLNSDGFGASTTIKLTDAYCVKLRDELDVSGLFTASMKMTLELSADQISKGSMVHQNHWPT